MGELQWAVVGEEYGDNQRKGWPVSVRRNYQIIKEHKLCFYSSDLACIVCIKQCALLALKK